MERPHGLRFMGASPSQEGKWLHTNSPLAIAAPIFAGPLLAPRQPDGRPAELRESSVLLER
jgi:hypothetical protein